MRLKQGNIIKLDFNPVKGHEQAGIRPAVVVSGNTFNGLSNNIIVCPITNTNKGYPTHIALDERTTTTGYVMCDQIRTVSPDERKTVYIEQIPQNIMDEILDVLKGILEF
ncbi:MAG: type II toxin-antitoxin system PemK/MazF family toxin [Oscillospiraceae bacterium]|nr:type II toxin-antitoxin system PemK/MazF family toxin [Oscillospiraceae bacterium]